MDRSDVIYLVSQEQYQDEYGQYKMRETKREVYCQVESVSRAEFFEGGRSGLNPEFVFTMFEGDYNGETIIIYRGKSYAVYRTYLQKNDKIELHVERKGGTNGKAGNN